MGKSSRWYRGSRVVTHFLPVRFFDGCLGEKGRSDIDFERMVAVPVAYFVVL